MLDGFRNLRVAASSGAALLETLDSIGGASVSGGIGRAEFALGMLATLKYVNMAEDVQPLLDCFDAADTERDGVLSRPQVKLLVETHTGIQIAAHHHSSAPKVASIIPVGGGVELS